MSWALTAYGKSRRPLAGVPWRTLTDAEYAAACELHPGMAEQGYFAQTGTVRSRREGRIDVYDIKPDAPAEVTNG